MPKPSRPVRSPPLGRRTFLVGSAALVATACASGETAGPAPTTAVPTGVTAAPTTTSAPTTTAAATTTVAPAARFVVRGPDTPARVALTFHTNGDLQLAQRLVDALRAGGAVATCFIIGNWLEANPTWARRLVDAGHELANHTWTHPDAAALTPARLQDEIVRCRDLLRRLTGDGGRFFRPSGTDDGTMAPTPGVMEAATAAGYPVVAGFDVDPLDFRDPGAAAVRTRALDAVRAGSIVSLHFGHAGTVEALPGILAGLRQRGLEPVTLSRLLAL
jgi:peptidoglycan/xylan/chitin deacetylase (PgdA/CDA1 family)